MRYENKNRPIDCADDEQMVALGLRQPMLEFKYLIDINNNNRRIGRDYVVKSDAEKEILVNIPSNIRKHKFGNNQLGSKSETLHKLQIHVKNKGKSKASTTDSTKQNEKSHFFKTTYSYKCAKSDINSYLVHIKNRLRLEVTKVYYNGLIYNI